MSDISNGLKLIENFSAQNNLRQKISELESSLRQKNLNEIEEQLRNDQIATEILTTALQIKDVVGQLNTIIHTWGIFISLPYILSPEERVEYVSLGAGNTGRLFDLKTTQRVAEFKFITWKGGSESIRQNSLFKDFYNLVENGGSLEKYLYVTGTEHPIRFFQSTRSLKSVLSKDRNLSELFFEKHQDKFRTVNEYYHNFQNSVSIVDLRSIVPEFSKMK